MTYIATMMPKPKRILVNHGESENAQDFARQIRQKFGIESHALKNLETIRLY